MVNSAHLSGKNVAEFLPPTGGVFEVSQTTVVPDVTCQVPCMSIAHHLKENHPGQLFTFFGSKGHRNDLVYACDAPEAPAGLLKKRQPSKLHKALHIVLVNTTDRTIAVSFVAEELPATSKHMRERRAKAGSSRVDVCRGRDTRTVVREPVVLLPGCINTELYLHPQFVCKTTFKLHMMVDGVTRHSWVFNVASANTQQKEGERSLPTQRVPRIFRLVPDALAPLSHTLLNVFDRDATYPFLMSVPTDLVSDDMSGGEMSEGECDSTASSPSASSATSAPVTPITLDAPPAPGSPAPAPSSSAPGLAPPVPSFLPTSFGSSLASLNAACMGASLGIQLGTLGKRKREQSVDEDVEVGGYEAKRVALNVDESPTMTSSPVLSSSTSSLGSAASEDGFVGEDVIHDDFLREVMASFDLQDTMCVAPDECDFMAM